MPDISPQATVEKGAKLSDDVQVGPFCYIGPDVEIGPGCVIENNATLVGRTCLGAKNHVFPMSLIGIGADGADDRGECIIGEANKIREHTTLCAGGEEPTRIGNDNLIMIGCYVGAGATVGDHGIFANLTQIGSLSRIEDYVRTSAFTFVDAGVTVGAYTFTAGYVDVDHDAPPFAMVHGSPFRIRGANTHNLRQCGFDDEDISELKKAFRELFNGAGNRADEKALKRLLKKRPVNPHVSRLLEAIKATKGNGG